MPKRFLCTSDQVAPASVVRVDLPEGLAVAVYNLDGAYYATDNLCTHGDASLAEGVVEGDNIICPFHGGTFDIRTGEPTAPPCVMPLRTYPVTVEDGQLTPTMKVKRDVVAKQYQSLIDSIYGAPQR